MMYEEDDDDDDNECLPVPRRSLVHRITNHFGSDNETSPTHRRQSRLILNNSLHTDSSVDETIQTPIELIALYEKTVELASKNKINAKNAFHFPFVERLPEILDIIAFDDRIDSIDHHHHEPNFVKAGCVIDTSAKIYGYRVDALHTETQKLNGSIQQNFETEEESSLTNFDEIEIPKKLTQRSKPKASSYLVSDLSTISLPYEFQFHPFQPSNMCQWPGGVGIDSLYADMVSYTMYSSSDFPLINGFIDLNNRINKEYDDYERILDLASKTNYDLNPLREVIKENEDLDHILGCQSLRDFSFNEDSTESYIETIDECSIIDSSLMTVNDNEEAMFNESFSHGLSEIRDDPSNFYFQELQSAHTFPTTMVSMDMTLIHSKISFVDHIPQLLHEKINSSDYGFFDSMKLKLFAGPYLWKYRNLFPYPLPSPVRCEQSTSIVPSRTRSIRQFKIDLFNQDQYQSLEELMSINSWNRKFFQKHKRKILSTTYLKTRRFSLQDKTRYQLRLSRARSSLTDLTSFNYFPDYNLQNFSNSVENSSLNDVDDDQYHFDPPDQENPFPQPLQYDFIRPIHYEKIEFDKNFSKIDAKKLQIQLNEEYHHQCLNTSNPISLSTLCVKLIDQGIISSAKDQIVSAFYCMLNNCNKNHLYMRTNSQHDDLIIQNQPFVYSQPLIYTHARI